MYRGYDRRLARPVAIKVIKPWWAEDPDGAESFEREAQLLARVSDPGIVQIFDVGQADEGLYFVTELVEGESLAARLKRGGPLPLWEACEIAEQLCRALEHAHAEHIVHRDIKPANVLISGRGQVKVGDLGIARLAEGSTEGGTATIVGTPRYMAPEQASGQPVTPATDVYSAGIVLYEMLAGRPPFGGESAVEIALQHVQLQPPPLQDGTPRSLDRVVQKALAKDPADRYQSAVAMADALARAREVADPSANGTDTEAPSADPWEAPAKVGDATTEIFARDTRTLPRTSRVDPTRPAPRLSPRRTVESGRAPAHGRRLRACARGARGPAPRREGADRAPDRGAPPAPRVDRGAGRREAQPCASARRIHARVQPGEARHRVRPDPGPGLAGQARVDDHGRSQQGPETDQGARARRAELHQRERHTPQSRPEGRRHARAGPWDHPGVVVRQDPRAGDQLKPRDTVALFVAEVPSWHAVTSFSARSAGGQSVPFRIQGSQWRVVYSMSYDGTCDFVFFCNGPSLQVLGLGTNSTNQSFDLSSGSGKTRVLKTGPGLYQIDINPGWDDASWSIEVQDWK